MPVNFLGVSRNINNRLVYVPKAGCGQLTVSLSRSQRAMGQSRVKPLVMCDESLWNTADFSAIISSIDGAGWRNWSKNGNLGEPVQASGSITGPEWEVIRGADYKNTIMIGAMLGKLSYGANAQEKHDYIVSAAPNVLWKEPKDKKQRAGYIDHTKGDNDGTQVHSEMIMAAQLDALLEAMVASRNDETIPNSTKRRGLAVDELNIDIDFYIEKGSLCEGCSGTWRKFFEKYHGKYRN